ncbi:MAG: FG-GAP-like repeat-containing protein [Pirellulaceae bacterium]
MAAWDFDQDGDQDLLFVNATHWPEDSTESTPASTLALYQNDGHGKFVDVTADWGSTSA